MGIRRIFVYNSERLHGRAPKAPGFPGTRGPMGADVVGVAE